VAQLLWQQSEAAFVWSDAKYPGQATRNFCHGQAMFRKTFTQKFSFEIFSQFAPRTSPSRYSRTAALTAPYQVQITCLYHNPPKRYMWRFSYFLCYSYPTHSYNQYIHQVTHLIHSQAIIKLLHVSALGFHRQGVIQNKAVTRPTANQVLSPFL
jgi:hypothetical protein